jgi:hypothetical protein
VIPKINPKLNDWDSNQTPTLSSRQIPYLGDISHSQPFEEWRGVAAKILRDVFLHQAKRQRAISKEHIKAISLLFDNFIALILV